LSQTKYSLAVLADNPIAFWKLDEASGLPQDSSGNAKHFDSVVGTPVFEHESPFIGAQSILYSNFAYHQRTVVSTAIDNFSIELWMKQLLSPGNGALFGNGSTSNNGYYIRDTSNFTVYIDNIAQASGFRLIATGWHQIVFLRRSGVIEYYLDGDLWLNNAGSTTPTTPTLYTFIGVLAASCDAAISNVSMYNTALSAAQIKAHYDAAMDIPQPPTLTYAEEVLADNPVAYWKLDEASGLPQDSSGNAKHFDSVVGTPVYDSFIPFSGAKGITFEQGEYFDRTANVGTATTSFSLEFWITCQNDFLSGIFKNGLPESSNGWRVITGGGGIQASWRAPLVTLESISPGIRGTARHVIFVKVGGTNAKWFVDGCPYGPLDIQSTGPSTPGADARLGDFMTTEACNFSISNVAYYETALSAERIRAHYDAAIGFVPINRLPINVPMIRN